MLLRNSEKGRKNSIPEQWFGLNSDLSNAGAVLYQLSYQADWELVIMWVNDKPVDDGISDVLKSHTVEPRLSGPRLSGLFDYPDFFSGPVFFMNVNRL